MTIESRSATEKTETQAIAEHYMNADAKNTRLNLDDKAYAVMERAIKDALPVFAAKYGPTRLNDKHRGIRLLKKNDLVLWLRNDGVLIELFADRWSDNDVEQTPDQKEIAFRYQPLTIRDKLNDVLGKLAADYHKFNEQCMTIIADDERKRQGQPT